MITTLLIVSSYITAFLIGAGVATFWWSRQANTALDMAERGLQRENDWCDLVNDLEAKARCYKTKLIEDGIEVDNA